MADNGSDPGVEIEEKGLVTFAYRPKVEEHDPSGPGDVQRFYVILRPEGGNVLRLAVIGRKHLPDLKGAKGGKERDWGFVEAVYKSASALEKALREDDYRTKTRGERQSPAVRPAGEGPYRLVRVDGALHLAYALSLPEEPGTVQKAFNIAPEGAFVLSVKNPDKGSPQAAGLDRDRQARYPKDLQAKFRDRRFADDDVQFLDYEGAEFVLVGAARAPQEDYDLDLPAAAPQEARAVRDLKMAKSRHPTEPLFEGRWA